MKNYIVCSAMPAYQEAPLSLELLKKNTEEVLSVLMSKEGEKHYLLVPGNLHELPAVEGLEVIEIDEQGGFVYGNHSAIRKVLEGEKPIPSELNQVKREIYSVEELLGNNKKQVFITGNVKKSGFYTVEKRITAKAILEECECTGNFKGMYLGYPMGIVIGEKQMNEELEIKTDYIEIYNETDCMLDRLSQIVGRFSRETCGRCVFGHEGVTQLNMILSDIIQKKGKNTDIELLLDLCNEMKVQSLCELGQTAGNIIITALQSFREEIEEHITKNNCKAGVCSKFVTYHIIPKMCIGCGECVDVCEEEAILGKNRFVHVIDQDECIQCGVCVEACTENAIIKAGLVKPRCPRRPIPCKR